MKKEVFKKYRIKKSVTGVLIVLVIICVAVYAFLAFYDNHFAIETLLSVDENNTKDYQTIVAVVRAFKDALLAIISIVITSILTIAIVDVKSKNEIVEEVITKDVFENPNFYTLLSHEKKEEILSNLEKEFYFSKNETLEQMYKHCKMELSDIPEEYYYSSCNVDIKCNVFTDYIEKNILKTIKLKSYAESYVLKEYSLASCKFQEHVSIDKPFELLYAKVGDDEVDVNSLVIKNIREGIWDEQRGYNTSKVYIYDKDIVLSNKNEVEIKVNTTSRVPRRDILYSCRMPVACETFEFKYVVENNRDIVLNTIAFGFIDDATTTPNNPGRNPSIDVHFDEWIYPRDGVIVAMCTKN